MLTINCFCGKDLDSIYYFFMPNFLRKLSISVSSFLVFVLLVQVVGVLLIDIVKVNERQAAVITRFGKVVDIRTAGWYFKVPWLDNVAAVYDAGVQSISAEAAAATKDQQTVKIKVNVQYQIDTSKANEIFKLVPNQKQLDELIVPPIIQEAVKSTSAKFSASELLEKRDFVKTGTEEALNSRLKEYYIVIKTVNIENLDFSEAYDKAIEQKVIAEQQVLQAQQRLNQEKLETEIKITKAKGDAESTKIKGEALKANPETIEKDKVDKWDGKLPQVTGAGSNIINLEKK
jgi:prohibitin 2